MDTCGDAGAEGGREGGRDGSRTGAASKEDRMPASCFCSCKTCCWMRRTLASVALIPFVC